MKPVEVFRINRESIVVPAGRCDSIEFARYYDQPRVAIGVGPFDGLLGMCEFTRERIPVIRICNFTQSRNNFGEPIGDEQFIAIEPELRHLLTTQERQQIAEIESLAKDLSNKLTNEKREVERLNALIGKWRGLPWYTRVWSAIKGEQLL